jgi:hypothetical protein
MGQCEECPHKPKEEVKVADEGAMQIGNTSISGVRTYSIILLVMVVYCYLALKNGSLEPMQELAFMICGYLFGAKVVGKR